MPQMYFEVSANYEQLVRLQEEAKKLEAQIKAFSGKNSMVTMGLETRLAAVNKQIRSLGGEAARAGAAMELNLKRGVSGAAGLMASITSDVQRPLNTLMQIAGVGAMGALLQQANAVHAQFKMIDKGIEQLVGSAERAKGITDSLREYAKVSPLDYSGTAKAAQQMLGFGIQAEKVLPFIKALGDVSMGNMTKFQGLTLAFSQMSAAGKLMGQDLNQMINWGFNPLQQIAQKTGKSIGQLKAEMSEGKISAEMVQQAFVDATSAGGKFAGMAALGNTTVEGQMGQLEDSISYMMDEIGASTEGASLKAIEGANFIVEHWKEVGTVALTAMAAFGVYKTSTIAANAIIEASTTEKTDKVIGNLQKEIDKYKELERQKRIESAKYDDDIKQMVTGGFISESQANEAQSYRKDGTKLIDDGIKEAEEKASEYKALMEELKELAQDAYAGGDLEGAADFLKLSFDAEEEYEKEIKTLDDLKKTRNEVDSARRAGAEAIKSESNTLGVNSAVRNANTVSQTTNTNAKKLGILASVKMQAAHVGEAAKTMVLTQALHLKNAALKLVKDSVNSLKVAWATNPFGLIATVLTTVLIPAISWLMSETEETSEEVDTFGETAVKTKSRVDALYTVLKTSTQDSKMHQEAVAELEQKCKEYNITIDDTLSKEEQLIAAKQRLIKAIQEQGRATMINNQIQTLQNEVVLKQGELREALMSKMTGQLGLNDKHKGLIADLVIDGFEIYKDEISKLYEGIDKRTGIDKKWALKAANEKAFAIAYRNVKKFLTEYNEGKAEEDQLKPLFGRNLLGTSGFENWRFGDELNDYLTTKLTTDKEIGHLTESQQKYNDRIADNADKPSLEAEDGTKLATSTIAVWGKKSRKKGEKHKDGLLDPNQNTTEDYLAEWDRRINKAQTSAEVEAITKPLMTAIKSLQGKDDKNSKEAREKLTALHDRANAKNPTEVIKRANEMIEHRNSEDKRRRKQTKEERDAELETSKKTVANMSDGALKTYLQRSLEQAGELNANEDRITSAYDQWNQKMKEDYDFANKGKTNVPKYRNKSMEEFLQYAENHKGEADKGHWQKTIDEVNRQRDAIFDKYRIQEEIAEKTTKLQQKIEAMPEGVDKQILQKQLDDLKFTYEQERKKAYLVEQYIKLKGSTGQSIDASLSTNDIYNQLVKEINKNTLSSDGSSGTLSTNDFMLGYQDIQNAQANHDVASAESLRSIRNAMIGENLTLDQKKENIKFDFNRKRNALYEKDENNEFVYQKDKNGNFIYEKDKDGNSIKKHVLRDGVTQENVDILDRQEREAEQQADVDYFSQHPELKESFNVFMQEIQNRGIESIQFLIDQINAQLANQDLPPEAGQMLTTLKTEAEKTQKSLKKTDEANKKATDPKGTKANAQSWMKWSEVAGQCTNAAMDFAIGIADLSGAMDEQTRKMLEGISEVASMTVDLIGGIAKVVESCSEGVQKTGESASGAMKAVEQASLIITAISMAFTLVKKIYEVIESNRKAKIEKQMDGVREKLRGLTAQYDLLNRAASKTYGTDAAKYYEEMEKNVQQQIRLKRDQIALEKELNHGKVNEKNKDKINGYLDEITSLKNQIEDLHDSALTAIVGRDIKSSIDSFAEMYANAWAQGKSAATDAKKWANDLMKQTILQAIKAQIQGSQQIKAIHEKLKEFMADGVLTALETETIEQMTTQATRFIDDRYGAALRKFETATTQDAVQGEIQSISEDTGREIEGRMNAIQSYVNQSYDIHAQNRSILTELNNNALKMLISKSTDVQIFSGIANQIANCQLELEAINRNTSDIVKPIKVMQTDMAEVKTLLKKLA